VKVGLGNGVNLTGVVVGVDGKDVLGGVGHGGGGGSVGDGGGGIVEGVARGGGIVEGVGGAQEGGGGGSRDGRETGENSNLGKKGAKFKIEFYFARLVSDERP
jgi:hypothetical protein